MGWRVAVVIYRSPFVWPDFAYITTTYNKANKLCALISGTWRLLNYWSKVDSDKKNAINCYKHVHHWRLQGYYRACESNPLWLFCGLKGMGKFIKSLPCQWQLPRHVPFIHALRPKSWGLTQTKLSFCRGKQNRSCSTYSLRIVCFARNVHDILKVKMQTSDENCDFYLFSWVAENKPPPPCPTPCFQPLNRHGNNQPL